MTASGQQLTDSQEHNLASLRIRELGRVDYPTCLQAMQDFTENRHPNTIDEFWIVEHDPVYTVGLNIRKQHLPESNTDIPVIESDRGGDITYHGPGQVIIYLLLDIRRRDLGIRQLVTKIEQSIIDTLDQYQINATRKQDAPGVYVAGKKIAALGLRVRRGCCYHGLSFNVDMDTLPFSHIPPCGYKDLQVTQFADLVQKVDSREVDNGEVNSSQITSNLIDQLQIQLGYTDRLDDAAR